MIASLFFAFLPYNGPQNPDQPIAFGHKKHLLLKLKCADCHSNHDPGEAMSFPTVSKCMVCHIAIAKDSPDLQKLRNFAKLKQEITWVRLNKLSDWVFWSHRTHLEANVTCESCHGPVASVVVTTMGDCVSCHQKVAAPTGCLSCHEGKH